ncbi:hypothetical protein BKH46_08575 [Helicobacter sp. 12S02634-8]|uniref:HD domain-containing protein n=1 Tax=Helicobacter sp. 12S02634-8 TaxID=1476199 RepID=UPI000BA4ECC0|nr:HD domain-containing protein [Helicobacter sp. 12S02634-8]PAF46181.1 hypothetical protein BKH46_08575 [Helicobacter sp. 12S02634-8]
MKHKAEHIAMKLNRSMLFLFELKRGRERNKILQKIDRMGSKNDFRDEMVGRAYQVYQKRFKTPMLNELVVFFLKNTEDFEFCKLTSVPKKYRTQHRAYDSMFDELEKVDLLRHTLRVFLIACEKNRDIPDGVAEEVALLALTHDFGKCPRIRDLTFSRADDPHNHVSAKYVSLIMEQRGYSNNFINLFYKTLFDHHGSEKESPPKDFHIEALNECDFLARKQEEKEVMKRKFINTGIAQ